MHARTAPVIQIVLQITVANAELQFGEELLVLHQVERIEHIVVVVLRRDQRIVHQVHPRRLRGHIVERVRRLHALVHRMVHNRRRQRIVADQIGDALGARTLHHVRTDDARLRREPVLELRRAEDGRQRERLEIVGEQLLSGGQITLGDGPEAGRTRRLR